MKSRGEMLPSRILLAVLIWGGACTIMFLATARIDEGDLASVSVLAMIMAISIFPYSLAGFFLLFSFRFVPWDGSQTIANLCFAIAAAGIAFIIGRYGHRLNTRRGAKAAWVFLALIAALGPLTLGLALVAADCTYPNFLPGLCRA